MAIHVRPTNRIKRKRAAIIRRILLLAFFSALFCITGTGVTLQLYKIYFSDDGDSSFVTYSPPEKKQAETRRRSHRSENAVASESSPPAASSSSVVISATDSVAQINISAQIDDLGAGLSDSMGTGDFGFGLADLGDGDGDGFGSGGGDGDGDGSGSGKGGPGYNDDIQVVLVLDASGSMIELFNAASASMEKVLTTLSNAKLNGKKTKVNVGIVIYGQAMKNGAPMKLSPFTTQVRKIRARLEKVACDGSIEECGAAIAFASDNKNFPWNQRDRDDMLKVIFIAGNEAFNQGTKDYKEAIEEANKKNIIINTIHCGPPDAEWEEAAELGRGVGLTLNITEGAAPEVSQEDIYNTLKALHNCPPLPIGPPAVQRRYIDMIKKAEPPPGGNPKKLQKWVIENKRRILQGYEWDAIEIYRHTPEDEFSIETLGGRGNLPVELRGKSDEEIIAFIKGEADRRTRLLQYYNEQKASGDLGDKILTVLQEQAQEKGITIDF